MGKRRSGKRSRASATHAATFFAMRTPLLSFTWLEGWADDASAAGAGDRDELRAALASDREDQRRRLREVLARPEVREAVFLASPGLETELDHWLAEPQSARSAKVERALVRYVARAAGRATPFGTFAGGSIGEIASPTSLALCERASYRRHTRLDCDYLSGLCDHLVARPALRSRLQFAPNSSSYRVAGRLRYAERFEGAVRTYKLVSVEPTDYLAATLDRASGGARLEPLARGLCADDPEVAPEEAAAFVDDLVDAQLLVPSLEPRLTGAEPAGDLVEQLRAADHPELADILATADAELVAIDEQGLGASPARYRQIAAGLEALGAPVDVGRLFRPCWTWSPAIWRATPWRCCSREPARPPRRRAG